MTTKREKSPTDEQIAEVERVARATDPRSRTERERAAIEDAILPLVTEVRRLRARPALPEATAPTTIYRDLSTPESREFWAQAEKSAAEVATWPAWKRAGINVAHQRPAPAQATPPPEDGADRFGGFYKSCPLCHRPFRRVSPPPAESAADGKDGE